MRPCHSSFPVKFTAFSSTILTFLILTIFTGVSSHAAEAPSPDKTLSPYFQVLSDDPETDRLPLESTSADVKIAGIIADVTVTQIYKNQGKRPIEAIYVFPASTRAAVYGMKMTIGERTIVARIEEREAARREYEEAKQAGKSASLLEQQRPNVFQMNVANIMPGDRISVALKYTEMLVPTDGVYEFVYPTVVGPRYANLPEADAPASEGWIKNPYLHEGEVPTYDFDFSATLSAGMPIDQITCPTHKTDIAFEGQSTATVRLAESESSGGDRDLILKYRLTGGEIQSGLLLYEGEDENFFLAMIQPPKRISPDAIPPREYIFVVDISGSMRGFPLEVAKTLLKELIGNLKPTDSFNVLLFAGGSRVLSKRSVAANAENIQKAIRFLDDERGGGGTELLPALQRAFDLPGNTDISRTVVISTDGFVSVERESFDLIRNRLGDANVFPFGIGSSVNRFLIEGMARVGMGEPFVVTNAGEAAGTGEKFRDYVQSPVLTDIEFKADGFDIYDVEPPSVPDVFAQRPVILFGKWRGEAKGDIRLTGFSGEEKWKRKIPVKSAAPNPANAALRYLWARHRIALLSDYYQISHEDDLKRTVTELGLKYNLLTRFTSFIAVDSLVRNEDGESTTVKQPLPLPQGVTDAAVGSAAPQMARSMQMAPMPVMPEPEPSPVPKAEALEEAAPVITGSGTDKDGVPDGPRLRLVNSVVVQGRLPRNWGVAQVEARLPEIEACIRSAASEKGELSGKTFRLRLKLRGDGAVTHAAWEQDERPAAGVSDAMKRLGECARKRAEQWRFPPTVDGGVAIVDFYLTIR